MSYRESEEKVADLLRQLEDRIRQLEGTTPVESPSWTVVEDSETGDLTFTNVYTLKTARITSAGAFVGSP